MVETSEDRQNLLADFGESVIWTDGAGTALEVQAIFDHEYAAALDVDDLATDSQIPMITVATDTIPGMRHGDGLNVRGTPYKVVSIQPDGTGISAIMLELAT